MQSTPPGQRMLPALAPWAAPLLVRHAMTNPLLRMGWGRVSRVVVAVSSSRALVTSLLPPGLGMTLRASRMW